MEDINMELRRYLFENEMQLKDFADKVGISICSMSQINNKKHYPSRETAKKIIDATDGQVTFDDLYGHELRKKNTRRPKPPLKMENS